MKAWQPLLLLLLLTLFVLPLGVLAAYAVSPFWRYPQVLPEQLDYRALHFVRMQAWAIGRMLASSVLYAVLTAGLTFFVCLAPAQALARNRFRGQTLLEGMLLTPALVPAMTFSMGVHVLFIRLGLTDSLLGVVLVLTVFSYPYMLRALVAGFQAMDPRYAACAANLGAGPLRRALCVELPLLLPSALAGGVVVFLVAFSEYFLVFLIGGGAVNSYATYVFPYMASSDRSLASVLTLIFLTVPILLFALLEILLGRHLARASAQ
ncbi:ABC transporter permease [Desulfocurvibacter africanus]|uniref:ABC-type transporter, integral membrane subunit n=1 Tax=Desulfocurvibacter africanus subsp. africanus str. Walvis Bay TaxID=690850 RepID=F3YTR1_DESAF|nr:ABC transporter permease subunit [Desulfocurvibacter africanus]EGJ48442.1 ABC-type transporter, integral membrane subunit [Desulfocurvibacter africanus subsp. africanus str. Walvis Bay]